MSRGLLAVVVLACAAPQVRQPSADTGVERGDEKSVEMSVPSGPGAPISGVATRQHETIPCRGGVAILPEEIQSEITPLGGATFTLLRGSDPTGKVAGRLTTDASGRFSGRLLPGEYCVRVGVVESASPPEPIPAPLSSADRNYDPECM